MSVPQTELEPPAWAQSAAANTANTANEVKHGYPPPRLSAGAVTTAYCGAPMIVEGTIYDRPPRDACPLCALAWRSRHRWPAHGWSARG